MISLAVLTPSVVSFLAWLTLFGQVIAVGVVVFLLTGRPAALRARAVRWVLPAMLIVAIAAMAGSLYFSEISGWVPCKLCWFQRIFLYPQAPLLLLALWKRDRGIASSILLLSAIGIVFSAVHYGEQVAAFLNPPDTLQPCDESGVSCAAAPFFHFGYITIPLMAFTASLLNGLGSLFLLRERKRD
ncbi:MAG: disulfide bond formation protein B [Candidatus Peribacteraceae bacterium]|nr:disulfide bond formation protein B [Candidatus Peribacteraceae bacterium]